jgi:hypothetical protein
LNYKILPRENLTTQHMRLVINVRVSREWKEEAIIGFQESSGGI